MIGRKGGQKEEQRKEGERKRRDRQVLHRNG